MERPRPPKAPALPLPPATYDPSYVNSLISVLRLYFNTVDQAFRQTFASTLPVTIPSADPLVLTNESDVFVVTGTTNFNDMDGGYTGRMVVLIFADSLTVNAGGNMQVNGAFNTNTGSTMRLIFDGTNWLELHRSSN